MQVLSSVTHYYSSVNNGILAVLHNDMGLAGGARPADVDGGGGLLAHSGLLPEPFLIRWLTQSGVEGDISVDGTILRTLKICFLL